MKKKILLSPFIIIVFIVLAGVGLAGAAVLIGGGGNSENVSLSKGLIGWWKMDGNTKDATPQGNNASSVTIGSATGGTITYNGGYTIHTFTSGGTFTPSGSGNVEVLVVGGGGGGGTSGGRGGGGGAGGYRYNSSFAVTAQAYSVTVGAGGDGGVWTGSVPTSTDSKNGNDSIFSTITATGGGRGGGAAAGTGFSSNGGNGGSGGGGEAYIPGTGGTGNTPSTSPSQGNNGGTGATNAYGGGGGGGARAVGANGTVVSGSNGDGGAGGAGTSNSITGSSVCYAGGGGGGSSGGTDGSATCGGGKGGTAQSAAAAGTANTGGGGGGAGASNAKAGGSGVVIVRYLSVGTFTTDRKGQVNKALAFNGQSDSSSASAALNWTSTSAFSYGGWFKLNDNVAGYMLASSNSVAAGALITSITKDDTSGKASMIVGKQGTGQTTITSSTAYTTGSWEYYMAVYDGANNMTLYRNGVSVATGSYSNGSATSAGSGLYMMYASNNTNYVNGSLDDVRTYNRALSATEVTALYQQYDSGIQVSDLQKGLVGRWKLDANAKDSTPYGNNGTLTGTTQTTDRKGTANKAYSFNGTTDSINLGTNSIIGTGTTPFTASMWFYPTKDLADGEWYFPIRLKQTTQFFLTFYQTGGATYLYPVFRGSTQWGIPITESTILNTWNHLVVLYDGGDKSTAASYDVYLNNVKLADGSVNFGAAGGSCNDNAIGSDADASCVSNLGLFKGNIDDVRIHNRALSAAEITALYEEYDSGIQVSNLQKGLVGNWSFDNGNAKDKTPYGNNGTITGATLTTDRKGQVNKAYSFNGTTDFISIANQTNFNFNQQTFTVAGWVKETAGGIIASKGGGSDTSGWTLSVASLISLTLKSTGGTTVLTVDSVATFNDGNWHHVVAEITFDTVTQNNNTAVFYADGVLQSTTGTPTGTPNASSANVFIGARTKADGSHQTFFNGVIDDVRIYNRALSAAEVLALYQSY